MPRVNIDAEFVVTATQVLNEGVSDTDHVGRTKLFQTAHRPQPGFEPPVIGFEGLLAYCSVM